MKCAWDLLGSFTEGLFARSLARFDIIMLISRGIPDRAVLQGGVGRS